MATGQEFDSLSTQNGFIAQTLLCFRSVVGHILEETESDSPGKVARVFVLSDRQGMRSADRSRPVSDRLRTHRLDKRRLRRALVLQALLSSSAIRTGARGGALVLFSVY